MNVFWWIYEAWFLNWHFWLVLGVWWIAGYLNDIKARLK